MVPAFFDQITRYESLSVVGMAKNVGKTVCLRALLHHYREPEKAAMLAVTSIGTDGESTDIVYKTAKPELDFYPGMVVQTAENYFFKRHLSAEILDVSRENTACGRLVTARVKTPGKLILSGYAYTQGLREYIRQVHAFGARTAIIDGALSRMSLASPFVSRAMILCTGAAFSKNMEELVRQTAFRHSLMNMPVFGLLDQTRRTLLESLKTGVHGVDADGRIEDLAIPSLLQIDKHRQKIEPYCRNGAFLYIAGLVNDPFLDFLSARKQRPDLIVSDFTKFFFSEAAYRKFLRSGSRVWVLQQPHILGVCVNPTSPDGYRLDSAELREKMAEALQTEVYDILG
ncbi:MAG: hypothetical protein K2L50_04720 [Bacteroidales bacterium]|nr:hypothetical protein [Bacteroidales bacterium]